MKSKILFLTLFVFTLQSYAQRNSDLIDSVIDLRKRSKNSKDFSKADRIRLAKRAVGLSLKSKIDSTILKSKRNLSYIYLTSGEYEDFQKASLSSLALAEKLNDTIALAWINSNLGFYNGQIKLDNSKAYDYYLDALKYFDAYGNLSQKAAVLTSLANIQDDEKDYLGSEQSAVEALRILNRLEDYSDLHIDKYYAFNLLGLVSLKLANYDQSIYYHNQAFEETSKIDNGESLALESLNNLAISYREKGDLKKSLEIFERIIDNPLLKNDMSFYGLVLDNYVFTKFLSGNYDYNTIENEFKKSLQISDSLNDEYTNLAVSIDLAKFYKANNKQDSAFKFAQKSYKLSKKIPINELYLESMLILSELTKGDSSKAYLQNYISLNDSLLKVERSKGNKFARIKYDTDQIQAENKQISKENFYLLIVSVGLLLTAILIYIVITQRAKNKQLILVQEQQKNNEEIYNLMLGQQDKVEEARAEEKIRVSKELHDGILGRLFGARLSLDSLNFSNGKDAIANRAKYIGQLKTIENDIREISHKMNTDFVSGSGFMNIVAELIENQSKAYGLSYSFNYTDDFSWEFVSNKTKINMYRIVQESLQNIYKHAEASHVDIKILRENDEIVLYIIDDGKGFDTARSKKGIGLKNMTSRVKDINATISFLSQINKGTTVRVNVPYNIYV